MSLDRVADALPAELRKTADDCLRGLGLAPERRDEVREELLAHLEERFRAERAVGRDSQAAARHAIAAFGPTEGIRRRLLLAATLRALREALRVPWSVLVIVLADVGLAAARFVLYADVYFPDGFIFRRWVAFAIPLVLLQALLVVVLVRLGLFALERRIRFGAGASDLVLGVAALSAALPYWIVQRPGLSAMALSDAAQAIPQWWPVWLTLGRVGWVLLSLAVVARLIEIAPRRSP